MTAVLAAQAAPILATTLADPTVEAVATHLENHTTTWLIIGAALGPIAAIALAATLIWITTDLTHAF